MIYLFDPKIDLFTCIGLVAIMWLKNVLFVSKLLYY